MGAKGPMGPMGPMGRGLLSSLLMILLVSPGSLAGSKDTDDGRLEELAFAETISHNSAISSGIVDSGPPVLITLVDTVATELADATRNVDSVDSGKLLPNYSDTISEHNQHVSIKLAVDSNSHTDVQDQFENISQNIQHEEQNENMTEISSEQIVRIVDDELVTVENASDEINLENVSKEEYQKEDSKAFESQEKQEEIPSFSEWAQKQLEEAEKNKEVVVNDSLHSVQNTVTSSNNFKVRSKNYASPDCGAKIAAANPEAGSASFILSPSRDEYMLNTCNSRIWFVVELCEAIQAKKVDLANFELFSSTPKNFSVSVSDRFPSREWAGVGQFIAKDERDIQTFNLNPHLFGKFIKVELHSHYGSEHYCPISLFRVYGTSEFEVFETENLPHSHSHQSTDEDDDDVLDEDIADIGKNSDTSRNLFGSARDAVMSIMKKAAEVLVKSSDFNHSSTSIENSISESKICQTPSHIIVCDNCSNSLFSEVYELMSCHNYYIKSFLESRLIYDTLCNTEMCQHYGLDFKSKKTLPHKTELASYISAFLMPSYVAALCNMLAIIEKKVVLNTSYETDLNVTSNLTIDKKTQTVAKEGLINELFQAPFTTCDEDKEFCQDKVQDNLNIDSNPIIISGSLSSHIKPMKPETFHKDNDHDHDHEHVESNLNIIQSNSENIHLDKNKKTVANEEFETVNENKNISNAITFDKESLEKVDENSSLDKTVLDSQNITSDKEKLNTSNVVTTADSIQVNDISNTSNNELIEEQSASNEQLSLDNLLNELEQGNNDFATPAPPHQNTLSSLPQGQKESVFLRLSNRIKVLEKNMSLSGQYLEELSRRYKKQVEEMQKTFEKTLLTVNEESKRSEERDHKNTEELLVLQQQIAHLSNSVALLLSERESWLGSISLLKIFIFQIIITTFIIYLFRRNRRHDTSSDSTVTGEAGKGSSTDKLRRKSEEVAVNQMSTKRFNIKRRPSEEALNIALNITDNSVGPNKTEKKRRKPKKSTAVQRSMSIANPSSESNYNLQKKMGIDREWLKSDLNCSTIEMPIALEEAEFIIPDIDPIDFNKMGEDQKLKKMDMTPKKDLIPKTNGSVFGMKTPVNNKKSAKVRRLSSPAFLKSALSRQGSRTDSVQDIKNISLQVENEYIPKNSYASREIKSEERDMRLSIESPGLHEWSSAGELSQTSSSATTNSITKPKKSKKQSIKNMLKKVF